LVFFKKKNVLLEKWRDVIKKIGDARSEYIKGISGKPLDYLIISEAPMLNYNNGEFACNYVFGNNPNGGSYRKVPYEALGGTGTNPEGPDLIKLFVEKKVGFFDLILIPLPKIDTELRRLWSQCCQYYICGIPRTMFFLELAFKKFMENSECQITDNTKVILMMPPNSAMGIISFYLGGGSTENECLNSLSDKFKRENTNCDIQGNPDLNGVPVRLHRQIVMNGSGGPDLKLFKHALMD
jgi:hypothetical protein